ncbi:MAG: hypothetical protein LBU32_32990 [Clostridiales bacterium]|nr:hypothetical protein [Clostridiales bacterium]
MDAKFSALIDALPFGKNACKGLFIMILIIANVEKEKIMALLGVSNSTYKKYEMKIAGFAEDSKGKDLL